MLPQGTIHILVVDDDEDDFVLVRAALEEISGTRYQTQWVSDWKSGLEGVLAQKHDAYLIDYRLGANSGIELIQEARAKGSVQPLILMTGQGAHEVDLEAMAAGASDYLPKTNLNAAVLERSIRYCITRHKTLEELRLAKLVAEEATLLKDKFVSLVSHDLRSPLSGLGALLEVALPAVKEKDMPETEDILVTAIKGINEMLQLTQDLLKVERFQVAGLRPKIEPVKLHGVIHDQINRLSDLAKTKGIQLENQVPETTLVFADRSLLGEVVQNLLANALKFTYHSGKVRFHLPPDQPYTLAVEDNGMGIPEIMWDGLFRYEVKSSRIGTEGEAGTGFGLPLCFEIVQAHGGKLWFRSQEGQGSTFYLQLPPRDSST